MTSSTSRCASHSRARSPSAATVCRRPSTHAQSAVASGNRFFPGDVAVLHGRRTEPDVPRSGNILAHCGGTLDFLDRPAHRHRSILVHVRRQAVGRLRMARGMPDGGPRRDWWSGHAPARDRHGPGRPLHLGGPSPAQERPALAAGCVPHHADGGRQREPPARSPSYQHDTLPGTDLRLALRFRGGTDRRGPAIPADPDLLGLVQHARRCAGGAGHHGPGAGRLVRLPAGRAGVAHRASPPGDPRGLAHHRVRVDVCGQPLWPAPAARLARDHEVAGRRASSRNMPPSTPGVPEDG